MSDSKKNINSDLEVYGCHVRNNVSVIVNPLLVSFFVLVFLSLFSSYSLIAQFPTFEHPRRVAQREQIDAKRTDSDILGKDALPRSREFKRIDSSYYVGWMYEGVYKYHHAADFAGYRNAITPLKKALDLLEKDYKRALKTRSSDFMVYVPVYSLHIDYSMIAYFLADCYNNTDQPEETVKIIRRTQAMNFQREFYFQSYNYLAWTIHRNRFYTSFKYNFLKNSIEENESYANSILDSALSKIRRDRVLNKDMFAPGYDEGERQSVYHYKAMLHSYALRLDSAALYYERMRKHAYFSNNNYATFLSIAGNFRQAEEYYKKASGQDMGDKRLQEWAYYSSILNIYKGRPELGVASLQEMIASSGSTPGFGWYNIGLARCKAYEGDHYEAERIIKKAEEFKEVHIGTTLGQSHYDFSVNLVKLLNSNAAIQRMKFENSGWWYRPTTLASIAKQSAEKLTLQYFIVNQFAMNPERDMVVYRLFSTESTVTWDEVWQLIQDFSTSFFYRKYAELSESDSRKNIKKYFRLNAARLLSKQGKHQQAVTELEAIFLEEKIDTDYEKLFIARLHEALAECYTKIGNIAAAQEHTHLFYAAYPQLLPYSDIKPYMRLTIQGTANEHLIRELKKFNIHWINDTKSKVPEAVVRFEKTSKHTSITYYVNDHLGNRLIPRQNFVYSLPDKAARDLAYRLFNIGKKTQEDTQTNQS